MKLTRTTLVVPLAGLLLVGAAGAVAATSSGSAAVRSSGVVVAAPPATPSPSSGTATTGKGLREPLLPEVLDGLVTDNTITDAQRTKILDALASARTARRDEAKAQREQLRTFLADGVITQQEYDQLPADSRLRQLATLMDDGEITVDELRSALRGFRDGRGGRGFGGGLFGGAGGRAVPSASPTTGG